jgi:hypothetical protein
MRRVDDLNGRAGGRRPAGHIARLPALGAEYFKLTHHRPGPAPQGFYWTARHRFATGRDLRIATDRAHSSVGRAADS